MHVLFAAAGYGLVFRYFPAILNAKDGNIIKTVTNSSFINVSVKTVSFVSGPEDVNTRRIPIIPKIIDAHMKIFVATACIL